MRPTSALLAALLAAPRLAAAEPRYEALPALTIRTVNGDERATVRLYLPDGTVDPAAVARLGTLLRDRNTGAPCPVVPRTAQLLVRIATHFGAAQVDVVSAYRTGRARNGHHVRHEGYHGTGSAIDFTLPGIDPMAVAAYARTLAHVGVGAYPQLGFVHLDSRDASYFWENRASARHHGHNRPLARGTASDRDAAWTASDDAPWDPPGPAVALDLHPATQPGTHEHHRREAREHHRHARRRHRELRVFRGEDSTR